MKNSSLKSKIDSGKDSTIEANYYQLEEGVDNPVQILTANPAQPILGSNMPTITSSET